MIEPDSEDDDDDDDVAVSDDDDDDPSSAPSRKRIPNKTRVQKGPFVFSADEEKRLGSDHMIRVDDYL